VTKDPRYQDFLLSQLHRMAASAAPGLGEPNGYFAGWVAQKALVGQLNDGWRTMLSSYDRKSTNGRTDCTLDKRHGKPFINRQSPSMRAGSNVHPRTRRDEAPLQRLNPSSLRIAAEG
jgi:hypothetical protein